ncbi:interleukin-12 subunit beta [Elgaria multicarinata webbii]|uniref:interleukin-12 subunit beta n=1 Tax=Elgaria multicarinata webbii TaxID=159646 RepID=UPI002FCD04A0
MVCVSVILMSLLALATRSEAIQEVRTNTHIVEVQWTSIPMEPPEQRVLICNISEEQNTSVYWTKDQKWQGNGMHLEITVREPPEAGTYNCWSNTTHKLLSSTTVYIMKKDMNGETADAILSKLPETNGRSYFKCMANNYSGKFKCFWEPVKEDSDLKFKVQTGTEHQPKSKESTSGNIVCEEPVKNEGMYSVSCSKEHFCPVTEEYHPTEMVLEVFHGVVYEKHTDNFFFKDIVKPDISKCQIDKNGYLTLMPPPNWSTPASYFVLTYQIKVSRCKSTLRKPQVFDVDRAILLQNGSTLKCSYPQCSSDRYCCFIRSRDLYYKHSLWSDWSEVCSYDLQDLDERA